MSNRGVRIRGAILIVLGVGLAGFMAWLLGEIAPDASGRGSPDLRFTGTADEGRLVNNVLLGVLALGIVFALYGLYMAATGKESRVMKIAAIVLLIALVVAALLSGETVRFGPLLQLLGR